MVCILIKSLTLVYAVHKPATVNPEISSFYKRRYYVVGGGGWGIVIAYLAGTNPSFWYSPHIFYISHILKSGGQAVLDPSFHAKFLAFPLFNLAPR